MDFVGGTIDVFGSLPDIVVDSRELGLVHPVGSAHMIPGTQLSENTIKEALITSFVSQCTTSPSECAVTESMFGDAFISRS